METLPETIEERKYAQDNKLIMATYDRSISPLGKKLIRMAITEINSQKDDNFMEYSISMNELAKKLEYKDVSHLYRDVKNTSVAILKTVIGVEDKNGSFVKYSLFSMFNYNSGNGTVTIKFNDDVKPFLLHLKNNFTQVSLSDILLMKHKYSVPIYDLIMMKITSSENGQGKKPYGKKHVQIYISVDEIRRVTATEKQFKQTAQLKEKVIFPALRDIEKMQTARMHCELTDLKEGRSIIGFFVDCCSMAEWHRLNRSKGQMPGQLDLFDTEENF